MVLPDVDDEEETKDPAYINNEFMYECTKKDLHIYNSAHSLLN
jgi:hypothetical protein